MTMVILKANLFQTLRIFSGEERLIDTGSPTTRSLLAFLLLNRRRPSDRRRLAFMFWPRGTESAARRNLRQYLHRVRRVLESADPQESWLITDGNSVQFNPRLPIWLDVDAFQAGTRIGSNVSDLKDAVSLYTGDLLEDIYEDWCLELRQNLHQQYIDALKRLSQALQQGGETNTAIHYAKKWLLVEPLDEAAYRRLMQLYALNGDRSRAVQLYLELKESLAQELGTEPLPETQAVLAAIQSRDLRLGVQKGRIPRQPVSATVVDRNIHKKRVPIVGREAELSLLEQAWTNAGRGQGQFVLITGESGIGKTRLVQEYLSRHADVDLLCLQTSCHELDSLIPFAPLRPIVEQAHNLVPVDWKDDLAPGLNVLENLRQGLVEYGVQLDAVELRGQITAAFMSLLDLLAVRAGALPVHLILDDIHWGDAPTWEVLATLARNASDKHLLVIGMCRLEDTLPERSRLIRTLERHKLVKQMPLVRLTKEESTKLTQFLLPHRDLTPQFMSRIYQETEGNPFFIIEMVRSVHEMGKIASVAQDGSFRRDVGLPLSIQRVIEARLDRLSVPSQELLATAAAIGRAFTLSLLEDISQTAVEDVVACIDEWLLRGLVNEQGFGYDFSHAKIRQVAYNNLSRARRQFIHRRIAEVLENSIPPAAATTLAYHYARSDQTLKALPYFTQAGEQALRARSYLEARQFGSQAVSLLGRMSGPRRSAERIDLNLQLAQAYAFTGDLVRAQEILGETEHLALTLGDDARLSKLFHRSSQVFWLRGQPDVAGDYARRTLRVAEEQKDPQLLQAALRMLGRVSIALSAFDDAIAYLVRYVNFGNIGTPPADLPIVLGYLGVAYSRVGSWNRARDASQRGVTLAEQALAEETAKGLKNLSEAVYFARMQLAFVLADYRDWRACMDVLRPVPDPLGDISTGDTHPALGDEAILQLTPLGFMLLGLRGLALSASGRPLEGAELIRPALAWAEQTGYRVFHYLPRIFLVNALIAAGDLVTARAEIERALLDARTAGNRWATALCLRLLAEILTRGHEPDWPRIESYLIESMVILRQVRARPDLARTYLALRRLYDRAGQIAWAVDCHFRATTIFEELGMGEELRQAQGQASREHRGAVVIPGLSLRGPNAVPAES